MGREFIMNDPGVKSAVGVMIDFGVNAGAAGVRTDFGVKAGAPGLSCEV